MNTDNILVSCIIPVYNRETLIKEAVNSVLAQSHRNLELVVVDDGSTDNTYATLETINDPRLKIIRQHNKGVSSARNTGIAQCRGKYIALLDSDDYWLKNKLEAQLEYMTANGYLISQTNEIWIRKGKRVNPMKKHAKPEGFFFRASHENVLGKPFLRNVHQGILARHGPVRRKSSGLRRL